MTALYRALNSDDTEAIVLAHPREVTARAVALGVPPELADAFAASLERDLGGDLEDFELGVAMRCVDFTLDFGIGLQTEQPDACTFQMVPHAATLARALVSCPDRGGRVHATVARAVEAGQTAWKPHRDDRRPRRRAA